MGTPDSRGICALILYTLNHKRTTMRRVSVLRDPGYMEWLKERPCVACMKAGRFRAVPVGLCAQWWTMATIDPAHTLNNGRSSKGPDSSCIPLCRYHHDEMDGRLSTAVTTKEQFAEKYGLDLAREAEANYALYRIDTMDELPECNRKNGG